MSAFCQVIDLINIKRLYTFLNLQSVGKNAARNIPYNDIIVSHIIKVLPYFCLQKVHSKESETNQTLKDSEHFPENTMDLLVLKKEHNIGFKSKDNADQLRIVDLTTNTKDSEELKVLRAQLDCVNDIKAHLDDKAVLENVRDEWQLLGRVLDRVFIVLFLLEQIVATLVIMITISSDHDVPDVQV